MLTAAVSLTAELAQEHVSGGREFWVCVEVTGAVVSLDPSTPLNGNSDEGMGLDIALLLDMRSVPFFSNYHHRTNWV